MDVRRDDVLALAVEGDEDALRLLLNRHGSVARRRLAGQIPPKYQPVLTVDDVLQQSYADVVAHIANFESDSEQAFAKWLRRIAERNLIDALRGLDRKPACLEFEAVDPPIEPGTTPTGEARRGEREKLLQDAMAQLPERYAKVVRMYDLEERSAQEVADALGRTVGAVYMLRARAIERLRELLPSHSQLFTTSA